MSLIKLFLLVLTFPQEAMMALNKVDWQSYAAQPAVAAVDSALAVATEPAPAAPAVEEHPMPTTNAPGPARGLVVVPPEPVAAAPAPSAQRAEPNPKMDKDMVYKALFGTAEEISAMVEKGGRVEATNDRGESTLAIASKRVNSQGIEVVKALLAGGADVDQRDKNGETTLFNASRAGNLEAVKLLLEAGVHYYWTNAKGEIARTYAFRGGYKEIVETMDQFVLASNERTRKAAEEARRAAEAKRRAMELADVPAPPPVDKTKQMELAHQVGVSTCRYQYWYYVTLSNLAVAIPRPEIDKKMDEYKGTNTLLATALIRELQFPATSVDQLQQAAAKSIFDELQAMESNINRKAKGVGTEEDATERCDRIVANVLVPLKS